MKVAYFMEVLKPGAGYYTFVKRNEIPFLPFKGLSIYMGETQFDHVYAVNEVREWDETTQEIRVDLDRANIIDPYEFEAYAFDLLEMGWKSE